MGCQVGHVGKAENPPTRSLLPGEQGTTHNDQGLDWARGPETGEAALGAAAMVSLFFSPLGTTSW
jgi:hypothetical protein